ncbi:MAG: TIGR00282 family metallophosphoesterase [Patescibacteria group bacterium]|nr:TIGR00282 family metallophosphoesterase [Patescibacteria group bacterium]
MRIIFFGDIVGKPGRYAIKKILPKWKKKYQPDLIIANGENMAHGRGMTEKCLKEILDAGIDFVTSGDHILDQENTNVLLTNKEIPLIRPANMLKNTPGDGYRIIQVRTKKILIINLIGQSFMKEEYDNPFIEINKILENEEDEADIIIIDWHAETTAEKVCMGWHVDGRVTALLGTHTHTPTADTRILPKGTAFVSDVGMVGIQNSSLGADKDIAVKRFLTGRHISLRIPKEGAVEINAILFETNKYNLAKKIERLKEIVAF